MSVPGTSQEKALYAWENEMFVFKPVLSHTECNALIAQESL